VGVNYKIKNMKKTTCFKIVLIALLSIVYSCNNKIVGKEQKGLSQGETAQVKEVEPIDTHSSKNSLDWEGVYKGVLPCADCEGIKTTITLFKDNTYSIASEYLGKSDNPVYNKGIFIWNQAGSIISLDREGQNNQYKVGENVLIHLDNDGNPITGDLADKYKLMKNYSDLKLENKKWVLTELMGQIVEPSKEGKIAFVTFSSEEARVSGNNGCNLFSGGYELKNGGRIEVGQMINTMMACNNMDQASTFMSVLQKADNYTVVDDILHLNKARMAPLAKFTISED
jgi:uncharacterized lipoprotein NlpE involved in copper resistance